MDGWCWSPPSPFLGKLLRWSFLDPNSWGRFDRTQIKTWWQCKTKLNPLNNTCQWHSETWVDTDKLLEFGWAWWYHLGKMEIHIQRGIECLKKTGNIETVQNWLDRNRGGGAVWSKTAPRPPVCRPENRLLGLDFRLLRELCIYFVQYLRPKNLCWSIGGVDNIYACRH